MGETPEVAYPAELNTKQAETPGTHEARSLTRIEPTEQSVVPMASATIRTHMAAVEPIMVDDAGVLRAQIEQTRSEMSETIDAIKTRLDPHRIMEDAKYKVRIAALGSTVAALDKANVVIRGVAKDARSKVKDVGAQAVGVAKRNPVPVTVAGAALGWIVIRMWLGRKKRDIVV